MCTTLKPLVRSDPRAWFFVLLGIIISLQILCCYLVCSVFSKNFPNLCSTYYSVILLAAVSLVNIYVGFKILTFRPHLNWLLSPITINNWLEMMLQFIYQKLEKKNKNVLTPHFSSTLFKRLCQLLDLVTLDITSLRFSYGVLVAAAIYILVDPQLAISSSGLKKDILEPCVQWMSVYWKILRDSHASEMADVNSLLTDRSEIYFGEQHPELQTHNISMELYDIAQKQFELLAGQKELPPSTSQILTPPSSSSKSLTCHNDEDLPC